MDTAGAQSRLNAPAAAGDTRRNDPGAYDRTCLECGGAYRARMRHSDFCSPACRRAFNNRRAVRGAEIYDLYMALRYDRETAKVLKVWRLLNRMAAIFREEDEKEREGRPSWRSPRAIIDRRPYLTANVFKPPRQKRRGKQ